MEAEETESMLIDRRTFLKTALLGLATASVFGMEQSLNPATAQNQRYTFLYDSETCIGCNLCHFACKNKHNFPKGRVELELTPTNWLYVSKAQSALPSKVGTQENPYVRYSCMHCEKAMCQLVCPVEAVRKWKGLVYIDPDRCIGCGYCVNACPYGRPHKNEGPSVGVYAPHGVSRKCDGCYWRVQDGKLPACANACPTGALRFGPRDDIVARAQNAVSQNQNLWIYGLKELGGLGVLYLFPKTFDPVKNSVFPKVETEGYVSAVGRGPPMLVAAGIGGLLTLGALRMRRIKEVTESIETNEDKV
ncbi:MAG: 4Fe-4S dicluster domain-containing protein [Candidatus Heimdallarchaeota archaeon]